MAKLGFGSSAFAFFSLSNHVVSISLPLQGSWYWIRTQQFIIGSKIKQIDLYPFRMFISPTLVVSNTILFLALLCHSSEWRYYRQNTNYWQRQGSMIGSLVTAMVAGNILSCPGLYIMQKVAEYKPLWQSNNAIYTIFGSSFVVWRLALHLNQNPEIVTGMFKLE